MSCGVERGGGKKPRSVDFANIFFVKSNQVQLYILCLLYCPQMSVHNLQQLMSYTLMQTDVEQHCILFT